MVRKVAKQYYLWTDICQHVGLYSPWWSGSVRTLVTTLEWGCLGK